MLAIAQGQCPPAVRLSRHELDPGEAGHDGDEGNRAVRVLPGRHSGPPFTEIEDHVAWRLADRDFAERRVLVAIREPRGGRPVRRYGKELTLARDPFP